MYPSINTNYFDNEWMYAGLVVCICAVIAATYCAKQKDWKTCLLLVLVGITGITSFYVRLGT